MRADKLQKLVPKPDVSIPIYLFPILSQTDRTSLINRHFRNIIAYLKLNGYDPDYDYAGDAYKKALKAVARKQAEYNKGFAEVTAELNKEAKKQIMRCFRVWENITGVDFHSAEWKKPIVYEYEHISGGKIVTGSIRATPEEVLRGFFDGAYNNFDANPLTEKKDFRREMHEKLDGHIFSAVVFDSRGYSHRFEIKLIWKV